MNRNGNLQHSQCTQCTDSILSTPTFPPSLLSSSSSLPPSLLPSSSSLPPSFFFSSFSFPSLPSFPFCPFYFSTKQTKQLSYQFKIGHFILLYLTSLYWIFTKFFTFPNFGNSLPFMQMLLSSFLFLLFSFFGFRQFSPYHQSSPHRSKVTNCYVMLYDAFALSTCRPATHYSITHGFFSFFLHDGWIHCTVTIKLVHYMALHRDTAALLYNMLLHLF